MCMMSVIMEYHNKYWNDEWQKQPFYPKPPYINPTPTQQEIDWVKKIVEEAKIAQDLLNKAAEYDKITGQPNCEMEDKKKALLDLAKLLGIQINFPEESNNGEKI